MGGKFSRDKGQRGEREVASILNGVVKEVWSKYGLPESVMPVFGRNLVQTQSGGHDLDGVDWLAVEVKRHETEHVKQWWEQAKGQAKAHEVALAKRGVRMKVHPVLMWRKNNCKWQVRMIGDLVTSSGKVVRTPTVVSLEAFLAWFRLELVASSLGLKE